MNSRLLMLICLLVSLLRNPTAAMAQNIPQMPNDLDRVDIFLHTVDVGNLVYNNFGHTAIRVRDESSGQDWVFNWGIFDFGDPIPFALKFYRGILIYKLGVYPYSQAFRQYQYERRTVWEDQLNLTHSEKKRLLERLIWNAQPENRAYEYQYFFDNCSTRPRDYLNEGLGGLIRKQTTDVFTENEFRDYVRQGYRYNPFIQLSLDILMNSRIDQKVSVWDSMFHPLELREALLKIDDGRPIVYSSRILVEFPRPEQPLLDGFTSFAVFGLIFLVPVIVLFTFERQRSTGLHEKIAFRLLGLFGLIAWFYGGFLGFLMPVTWMLSNHLDLHHNVNMMIFWPTDLVMLIPSWVWLWKGRAWRLSPRFFALMKRYAIVHIALMFAMAMSWAFGFVKQDLDQIIFFVMPVYLALFSLFNHKGLAQQPAEEKV
ncbi:MAG: DUF4105 domain-containing protein [Oligoflexus sp.]